MIYTKKVANRIQARPYSFPSRHTPFNGMILPQPAAALATGNTSSRKKLSFAYNEMDVLNKPWIRQ
jgi:hypothetical protein